MIQRSPVCQRFVYCFYAEREITQIEKTQINIVACDIYCLSENRLPINRKIYDLS